MATDAHAPIQRIVISVLFPGAGLAGPTVQAQGPQPPSLADLRKLPHVAHVEQTGPIKPTHRIIHIADWHYVRREAYAADLRAQAKDLIDDEEIDRHYTAFLNEVEAVQEQQIALLRALIQNHKLSRVHVEGLAARDSFIFKARVRALKKAERELADLRKDKSELLALEEPDDETNEIIEQIKESEEQHRRSLLQVGAAGRLLIAGELEAVLPLEDAEAHASSNPVSSDGSVAFDGKQIEAREDAQVRLLLGGAPVAVIILGGGHNLADNVGPLSGGKAEYIRVELKAWKRAAKGA